MDSFRKFLAMTFAATSSIACCGTRGLKLTVSDKAKFFCSYSETRVIMYPYSGNSAQHWEEETKKKKETHVHTTTCQATTVNSSIQGNEFIPCTTGSEYKSTLCFKRRWQPYLRTRICNGQRRLTLKKSSNKAIPERKKISHLMEILSIFFVHHLL